MFYKQLLCNGIKVNVAQEDIKYLRLLQSSNGKAKLSQFRLDNEKPSALINCSYFTNTYVLGRNQGDVSQDTSSFNEQKYLGFAINDDLTYKVGELEYWDVAKSVCGFTPSTICMQDGEDVTKASTSFVTYNQKMNLATCVTMFGILEDKRTCLLITCEKGLSGYSLAKFIKQNYKLDFLCVLDGGGSTEMIIDGNIIQKSTDGTERAMFNGLGFKPVEKEAKDFILMYPCFDGWDSQGNHDGGACDIGWLKEFSKDGHTDIYACEDGVVEYEGYYKQTYGGKTYNTICVIIRHPQLMKTKDVCTIYWHLSSTVVDKGQQVKRGDKIGVKGNTGNSSGVHLHLQCLELEKGEPLPTNYDGTGWRNRSFYPVPFMRVFPNTTFKSVGNFTLENYIPNEEEQEDAIIKALRDEIEKLKEEIEDNKKLREIAENGLLEAMEENVKLKALIDSVRALINE